jgi:hypothetical protein
MKKCFAVALLALPVLVAPACAEDPFAPCFPYRVECGANAYFRVLNRENGYGCQLGPWYNYWPLEAHFQTPALPQYPFWPAPQALVPGGTASTVPVPGCAPAGPAYPSAVPGYPPTVPAVPTAAPAATTPPPTAPARPGYFRPVGYDAAGYYYQQGPWWYYGR